MAEKKEKVEAEKPAERTPEEEIAFLKGQLADAQAEAEQQKAKADKLEKDKLVPKRTMQMTVRKSGLEESEEGKPLVRVLQESYIHGAIQPVGSIIPWPKGVEVLGKNLEEFKG